MINEPMDDEGFEETPDMLTGETPREAVTLKEGHIVRTVNGVEIVVKIPTPHQVVAFERVRQTLYAKARKIQDNSKGLDDEDLYRLLIPVMVDVDSKTLAFAESMVPGEDDRSMIDEWLIQGVVTPNELVMALQGRPIPKDDDEDPEAVEVKKRPNPLKKSPTKKTANARRTKR